MLTVKRSQLPLAIIGKNRRWTTDDGSNNVRCRLLGAEITVKVGI